LCLLWGYACFGEEGRDGCARTRGVGAGPAVRRRAHARAAARPRPFIRTPLGWGLAPPSGASRERLSFTADDLTEGGGCYRRARFRHGALSLAATADVGAAPGAIPVCQPPHHHIHQKKRPPPCQPQLCHERSSRAWRACGVTVLGGGSQSLVSGVKVEVAGNADTRRESHILRSASTGRRDIRRDVLDGGCHASSEISASCWQ